MTDGVPGPSPRLVRPAAALAVGLLIVVMMAGAAVIASAAHQSKPSDLGQVVLWFSFGLVGVVVAWHQPRNPMGWVLLGVTFFFVLDALGTSYAYLDYRLHGGRLPLGWLSRAAGPLVGPSHRAGRAGPHAVPGRADPGLLVEADAVGLPRSRRAVARRCVRHLAGRGHRSSRPHRLQRRAHQPGLPGWVRRLVGCGTGGLLPRGRGVLAGMAGRAGAELPALIGGAPPAAEVAAERGDGLHRRRHRPGVAQ